MDLTLAGVALKKADPNTTVCHLGIPVQLDQLCGSGGRTVQLDETQKFLPSVLQQVKERAEEIVSIENLNPINALEVLDSMAKAKALYICKITAVPVGFLKDLNSIIANAARQEIRVPRNQGSRNLVHAPTFMRGISIKSMEDHYHEALLSTYYKLLQSRDQRVKEVIRVKVLQFLEDTNTGMLDLLEEPANHEPKVFFYARAEVRYEVVDDTTNEKRADWNLIPKDEMRPRLQLEKGRTLLALLYKQSKKYQIAIGIEAWFFFDGQRWSQIPSEKEPKKILRHTW